MAGVVGPPKGVACSEVGRWEEKKRSQGRIAGLTPIIRVTV